MKIKLEGKNRSIEVAREARQIPQPGDRALDPPGKS